MTSLRAGVAVVVVCLCSAAVHAQFDLADPSVSGPVSQEQEATLTFENRPILVLRARVVTRMPSDRAAAAVRLLQRLVARDVSGPVEVRPVAGAQVIAVAGEAIIAVLPADVDVLTGESVEAAATAGAVRLRTALLEARELRSPRVLLQGALAAVAASALLWAVLWLLIRVRTLASEHLTHAAERRMSDTWRIVHGAYLPRVAAFIVKALLAVVALVLMYLWLAFVLRQFPYTRVWGESLRGLLVGQLRAAGAAFASALPGIVTVIVIVLITRGIVKAVSLVFSAAERGRMSLPGVYPDTAVAARRLVISAIWLLAAAMAYPHVPGSDSSAFKGLSVFVGVVISLGSSGVMQHLMSGMMLTFSRAMHVGDFARIGDVVGTVVEVGGLATKIRTPYGEEVTIPNAVVVAQTTTNYSNPQSGKVPLLTTSVTIGYDTPWRQVEELLLLAARETPGLMPDPKPVVWREALQDFYIKYTLLVTPQDPQQRAVLLDRLHGRILDAFNTYGVQIMSPHYYLDPREPKVVPPARWHDAPASVSPAVEAGRVTDADAPRHL